MLSDSICLCVVNTCFIIVTTDKWLNSIICIFFLIKKPIVIYLENNYSITTLVFWTSKIQSGVTDHGNDLWMHIGAWANYHHWPFTSTLCRSMVFSGLISVSFTNKTDHHDITEILLKVALNTITLTHQIKQWIGKHACQVSYQMVQQSLGWRIFNQFSPSLNSNLCQKLKMCRGSPSQHWCYAWI